MCNPTCAGLRLLTVDLQEDECREEQQPAVGLIRGLPQRGPPALRGWVQDSAEATDPGRRGKPGGRGGERRRGEGAGCLRRPQGHRERSAAGGGRHGRCLMIFFNCLESFQITCFLFFYVYCWTSSDSHSSSFNTNISPPNHLLQSDLLQAADQTLNSFIIFQSSLSHLYVTLPPLSQPLYLSASPVLTWKSLLLILVCQSSPDYNLRLSITNCLCLSFPDFKCVSHSVAVPKFPHFLFVNFSLFLCKSIFITNLVLISAHTDYLYMCRVGVVILPCR